MSAAPEINSSISLLWEDTCWTALIVPSSLSAASRYASPIVCLFLFCPLKYGHKFTKGTCSPRPRWGTITQWKNMVKISKGSAVRQGRRINRVMISPEFLPRAGVTRKQRKWWHILTQDPGKSNPDILFRARDSSSANYRGKRRARFSQRRLRLRSLPKQPGARGPKELFIYELKPLRIKHPPLFCRRHERPRMKTKRKKGLNTTAIGQVYVHLTLS